MFGAGLVSALHPDAGQGRVDEQVGRPEGMGPLGGGKRGVEAAQGKMDLGEGMPGFERSGGGGSSAGELRKRRLAVA